MSRKPVIEIPNLDPFSPVTLAPLSIDGHGKQSSRFAVMLHPQTSASVNEDGTGAEVIETDPVEVGIVSGDYKLVPNLDVHEIAQEILRSTGLEFKHVRSLFDGRKYTERFQIPSLALERAKGDVIALTLDLFNSYDGSTQYGFAFNALRLVCLNGMTVASMLGGFRLRHNDNPSQFERELETARIQVLSMGQNMQKLGPAIDTMMETEADINSVRRFLKETEIPRQYIPELIQNIQEPTEWGVYNAATRVLTAADSFAAEAWNGRVTDYMFHRFGNAITPPKN